MCTIFHKPLLSCHTRHLDISPILSMSLNVNTSSWSFSKGLLLVSDFFRWSSPVSPLEPKRMTYTLASVPAPGTLEVFTEILYVVPWKKTLGNDYDELLPSASQNTLFCRCHVGSFNCSIHFNLILSLFTWILYTPVIFTLSWHYPWISLTYSFPGQWVPILTRNDLFASLGGWNV